MPPNAPAPEQQLLEEIRQVYDKHQGRYGSPRITLDLRRQGILCSENRVARLMKPEGLVGIAPRRKKPHTTDSSHSGPIVPNLIKGLDPKGPNEIWVMDITCIRTQNGWVYLAAALDLYSRHIVGWQMASRPWMPVWCSRLLSVSWFNANGVRD